jgi:histidine ammonia-lyase
MTKPVTISGERLTVEQVVAVSRNGVHVEIDPEALRRLALARETIDGLLTEGGVYYGINTGFGALANTRIESGDLVELQVNLLRSHAVGVQERLPDEIVRGMMLLRLNTFAKGNSGVSLPVTELLLEMLNRGVHPVVPAKGSVGASGDLAPLASLSLPIVGEGFVEYEGGVLPARDGLKRAGLTPVELRPKDGLALINGTQLMTSVAALAVWDLSVLIEAAELVAAFITQALLGSSDAFRDEIHRLRPHPGQLETARRLREFLRGTEMLPTLEERIRLGAYPQDPYSVRCVPQVIGAVRDAVAFAVGIIQTEMNSVNDNPIIIPEHRQVISGGNFHGQHASLAMDILGIAACTLSNLVERQVYRLLDARLSNGLPPFLTSADDKPGLSSGFMAAQYAMAALASENKVLAHPASVDTIPTSADFEDFVSMGPVAALKLRSIVQNCSTSIAIALLCACRAVEYRGVEKLSKRCFDAYQKLKPSLVPKIEGPIDATVRKLQQLLMSGDLTGYPSRQH